MYRRYQSTQDGMKCLLRAEIIRDHSHYMEKGYIPIYAMENVLESYNAYHSLGGNGTITKMVEELKQLPLSLIHICNAVDVEVEFPDGTKFSTSGYVNTYVSGAKVDELVIAKLIVSLQSDWTVTNPTAS